MGFLESFSFGRLGPGAAPSTWRRTTLAVLRTGSVNLTPHFYFGPHIIVDVCRRVFVVMRRAASEVTTCVTVSRYDHDDLSHDKIVRSGLNER